MFNFIFKEAINERGSEAEYFILNQSDLTFSEWLLLLFSSEAPKQTAEKKILALTKLHLFFMKNAFD